MKNLISILFVSLNLVIVACDEQTQWNPIPDQWSEAGDTNGPIKLNDTSNFQTEAAKTAHHASFQLKENTIYDGSWVNIGYPGGDPGYQQGVCTDVVIRALRFIHIDLQELIHKDMKVAHDTYNTKYTTKKLDNNIDHRRTQNIQTYLTRIGAKIPIPEKAFNYKPGDIVFWDIAAGHTGIVSNKKSPNDGGFMVIHNIGSGAQEEDLLSNWDPIEVYRITDEIASKMQKNCTFKYDETKDFKRYVQ
jgi:uncharacterized protein